MKTSETMLGEFDKIEYRQEIEEGRLYLAKIKKLIFFHGHPFEVRIIKKTSSDLKICIENIHDLIPALSDLFKIQYNWIPRKKIKIVGEIGTPVLKKLKRL